MKISLFFGAGAELAYSMPSGKMFALDLMRKQTENNDEFIELMKNVIPDSFKDFNEKKEFKTFMKEFFQKTFDNEYREWMLLDSEFPRNLVYDKRDYKHIIFTMISEIKRKNKNYKLGEVVKNLISNEDKEEIFDIYNELVQKISNSNNNKVVSELFKKINTLKDDEKKVYENILKAVLSLIYLYYGKEIIVKLNKSAGEVFKDLGEDFSFFKFSYDEKTQDYIYNVISNGMDSIKDDETLEEAKNFILEIFDYSKLVENSYNYLFTPDENINKFAKSVSFQYKTWFYILYKFFNSKEKKGNNYYKLLYENFKNNILAIGTSNYCPFINYYFKNPSIYYLNGSIFDFYDPYKNEILSIKDKVLGNLESKKFDNYKKQIKSNLFTQSTKIISNKKLFFPLMATQTPLRPFGAFEMKCRTIKYYYKLKRSDTLIVLGYGFRRYDADINAIFKEFLNGKDKKIIILQYKETPNREHIKKIFGNNETKIHYINIKDDNDETFIDELKKELQL